MERQPKPQNSKHDDDSFYSGFRNIGAIGLAGLALAGFLFWVAAEVRWTQAIYSQGQSTSNESAAPISTTNNGSSRSFDTSTSLKKPTTVRSIVPDPMPAARESQTYSPTTNYTRAVYQQLVSTCNYWTKKLRAGESVVELQKASCKRMRDYARSGGYNRPATASNVAPPTIRPASRPATRNKSSYVRVDSNTVNDNRCENIDDRIDWLNSRLRAGYRVAEGERYKQELRDLKKEKYDKCR